MAVVEPVVEPSRPSSPSRWSPRRPPGAGRAGRRRVGRLPTTCRCPSGSTISTADDAPVSLHSFGLRAPARIFRAREHPRMSYAIISLGGKQYRVSEGQRLLVDRLATEDGKTFTPDVLLVGGDGAPSLAPKDVTVTVKVARSAARPEDPHRQVQEAHRLQAPHGVPLRSDADRDRVDRRQEEGCGEAEGRGCGNARGGGRGRGDGSRRGRGEAEGRAEAPGCREAEGRARSGADVAPETVKEDES